MKYINLINEKHRIPKRSKNTVFILCQLSLSAYVNHSLQTQARLVHNAFIYFNVFSFSLKAGENIFKSSFFHIRANQIISNQRNIFVGLLPF